MNEEKKSALCQRGREEDGRKKGLCKTDLKRDDGERNHAQVQHGESVFPSEETRVEEALRRKRRRWVRGGIRVRSKKGRRDAGRGIEPGSTRWIAL